METFLVSLCHIKQYRVMIVCDSTLGDMVLQLQTRCSTSDIVRHGYFIILLGTVRVLHVQLWREFTTHYTWSLVLNLALGIVGGTKRDSTCSSTVNSLYTHTFHRTTSQWRFCSYTKLRKKTSLIVFIISAKTRDKGEEGIRCRCYESQRAEAWTLTPHALSH